jgi:hypothetical protein
MKTDSLLAVLAVAAMMAAPASAASLSDYDVQKVDSWADALAICDITKFLLSEPNLESEVIIASVPGGASVALRRPLFLPPSGFYSDVMRETFERAQASGQVTGAAYSASRNRYALLMLSAYHGTKADQGYLSDRMRLCYALAVDASGRTKAADSTIKH